jgi:hypothetical protein
MRNSPIKDLRVLALFTTNSGIPTVPALRPFGLAYVRQRTADQREDWHKRADIVFLSNIQRPFGAGDAAIRNSNFDQSSSQSLVPQPHSVSLYPDATGLPSGLKAMLMSHGPHAQTAAHRCLGLNEIP